MGMATFTPTFTAWRFYNDDGSETTATTYNGQAQDTNITVDVTAGNVDIQLRVLIVEAGGASGNAADDYQLRANVAGGGFAGITSSSTGIQTCVTSGLSSDSDTTNRATNGITDPGSGSFVAGEQVTGTSPVEVTNRLLTASNFTEHVFAFTLISADLSDTDTITFEIGLNGGTPGMTNSVTPQITITKTPNLDPGLVTDDDTFHAPTVSRGAVGLTAGLVTDDDTFYAPTVAQVTPLVAGLVTDDDTFHAPAVTVGAIGLTASLYTDDDTFYAPAVTAGAVGLTAGLVTDDDTFYAPTVAQVTPLVAGLVTDDDTFHAPTVSATYDLQPSLEVDGDTFHAPTAAATYALTAGLVTDDDTIHAPTVASTYGLSPSLYSDDDAFYAPEVAQILGQDIAPDAVVTDGESFYVPIVTTTYALAASLLTDGELFPSASVRNRWENISGSQTPGWAETSDSQTTDWSEIG